MREDMIKWHYYQMALLLFTAVVGFSPYFAGALFMPMVALVEAPLLPTGGN
jgi:hypothetical protein